MRFNEEIDENWIDLSVEEFQRLLEEKAEVEIDLDEFISMQEELAFQREEEKELETERRKLVDEMRTSLGKEEYHKAFKNAKALRRLAYMSYREEIDECYLRCAEHGVLEAIKFEAEKYTIHGDGRVRPEAFPYLRELANSGYIKSFLWLADCYYYGIGCEKDLRKAARLYFEGQLFDDNDYCRRMYAKLNPGLEDYSGDDLITQIRQHLTFPKQFDLADARLRMAELILDGEIREYPPGNAYILFRKGFWGETGISDYKLGQCLLYGIGVEANPIVAKEVLEDACFNLKWITGHFEEDQTDGLLHKKEEYFEAYEKAQELYEEAIDTVTRMEDYPLICRTLGVSNEDDIYDEWYDSKVLYISRSEKDRRPY